MVPVDAFNWTNLIFDSFLGDDPSSDAQIGNQEVAGEYSLHLLLPNNQIYAK
jgi:hypothetical protein